MYYLSAKKKYEAATQAVIQSQAQAENKFQKVAQAYTDRNSYIAALAKKSEKNKELFTNLKHLNDAVKSKPLRIAAIEMATTNVNNAIFKEVESFRTTKKSTLFTQNSEIGRLEQYDRYIDLARIEYSNWTFEVMSKQQHLQKNFFVKTKNTPELEHFKVDHLIRTASTSKE